MHALLGSNGAGKSTLIKIISGIHSSSSGSITLDGKSIAFADPRDAQRHGISLVPQEFCLVPTLTAMQNVFLGRESVKGGLLDEKTMRAEYEKYAATSALTYRPMSRLRTSPRRRCR